MITICSQNAGKKFPFNFRGSDIELDGQILNSASPQICLLLTIVCYLYTNGRSNSEPCHASFYNLLLIATVHYITCHEHFGHCMEITVKMFMLVGLFAWEFTDVTLCDVISC